MKSKKTVQSIETVTQQSFSELDKQAVNKDLRRIKYFFKREPAVALTLCYLLLCITGLIYLSVLFNEFDVSIFPHLELSDFALSAIHYPRTLLVFLLLLIILILSFKFEQFLQKKSARYQRVLTKFYAWVGMPNTVRTAMIIASIYLYLAADIEGKNNHKALVKQLRPHYVVQLTTPIKLNDELTNHIVDVQVVANLSKHLWLYHAASKQLIMVAHESLLLLQPKPNKRSPEDKKYAKQQQSKGNANE